MSSIADRFNVTASKTLLELIDIMKPEEKVIRTIIKRMEYIQSASLNAPCQLFYVKTLPFSDMIRSAASSAETEETENQRYQFFVVNAKHIPILKDIDFAKYWPSFSQPLKRELARRVLVLFTLSASLQHYPREYLESLEQNAQKKYSFQ